MAGLRERKKRATRLAIHDAGDAAVRRAGLRRDDDRPDRRGGRRLARDGLQLLPDQGGDRLRRRAAAIEALAARLRERPDGEPTIARRPRLARRARPAGSSPGWSSSSGSRARCRPSAPAGCSSTATSSASSPTRSRPSSGRASELAARLAAASLVAGLRVVEETAAARMEQEDRALTERRDRPRCSTTPWPSPRPASPPSSRRPPRASRAPPPTPPRRRSRAGGRRAPPRPGGAGRRGHAETVVGPLHDQHRDLDRVELRLPALDSAPTSGAAGAAGRRGTARRRRRSPRRAAGDAGAGGPAAGHERQVAQRARPQLLDDRRPRRVEARRRGRRAPARHPVGLLDERDGQARPAGGLRGRGQVPRGDPAAGAVPEHQRRDRGVDCVEVHARGSLRGLDVEHRRLGSLRPRGSGHERIVADP